MRPIMTRAEHYSDMEVAAAEGWRAIAGWGRDGWDLGDWPYVVISVRTHRWCEECGRPLTPTEVLSLDSDYDFIDHGPDAHLIRSTRRYQMRQTVEGDTTVYAFSSTEDRDAAIDYLFVWYGIGKEYDEWAVWGVTSREALDAGTLRIPEALRGPYSSARTETSENH